MELYGLVDLDPDPARHSEKLDVLSGVQASQL